MKAEQEQVMIPDPHTAAEEAIAKELKVSSLPKNSAIFADDYRAAAVRREEVIQRVRRAREEMRAVGEEVFQGNTLKCPDCGASVKESNIYAKQTWIFTQLLSLLDQALQEKK